MGRYFAITFPTPDISRLFLNTLNSCADTSKRFIKTKTLAPRSAALLGVIPHSEILNNIADNAIPLTIMVTTDRRKRIQISGWLFDLLDVSATEKKINAITPINNALKISRKSLSLYGSLPEKMI